MLHSLRRVRIAASAGKMDQLKPGLLHSPDNKKPRRPHGLRGITTRTYSAMRIDRTPSPIRTVTVGSGFAPDQPLMRLAGLAGYSVEHPASPPVGNCTLPRRCCAGLSGNIIHGLERVSSGLVKGVCPKIVGKGQLAWQICSHARLTSSDNCGIMIPNWYHLTWILLLCPRTAKFAAEVWPFRQQSKREYIFHCGGEAAAMKNILLLPLPAGLGWFLNLLFWPLAQKAQVQCSYR